MPEYSPSRRDFLIHTGQATGAAWLGLSITSLVACSEKAYQASVLGAELTTLTHHEAIEIEAIAAQIVPTTDTPGAREAGVIYFIDTVLGGDRANQLTDIQQGLADFENGIQEKFAVTYFSELTSRHQIESLEAIQNDQFFEWLRFLTMAGMFSLPSYNGNKNRVGWELLGFEDRHFWQPPFGYYDEHYEAPEASSEFES